MFLSGNRRRLRFPRQNFDFETMRTSPDNELERIDNVVERIVELFSNMEFNEQLYRRKYDIPSKEPVKEMFTKKAVRKAALALLEVYGQDSQERIRDMGYQPIIEYVLEQHSRKERVIDEKEYTVGVPVKSYKPLGLIPVKRKPRTQSPRTYRPGGHPRWTACRPQDPSPLNFRLSNPDIKLLEGPTPCHKPSENVNQELSISSQGRFENHSLHSPRQDTSLVKEWCIVVKGVPKGTELQKVVEGVFKKLEVVGTPTAKVYNAAEETAVFEFSSGWIAELFLDACTEFRLSRSYSTEDIPLLDRLVKDFGTSSAPRLLYITGLTEDWTECRLRKQIEDIVPDPPGGTCIKSVHGADSEMVIELGLEAVGELLMYRCLKRETNLKDLVMCRSMHFMPHFMRGGSAGNAATEVQKDLSPAMKNADDKKVQDGDGKQVQDGHGQVPKRTLEIRLLRQPKANVTENNKQMAFTGANMKIASENHEPSSEERKAASRSIKDSVRKVEVVSEEFQCSPSTHGGKRYEKDKEKSEDKQDKQIRLTQWDKEKEDHEVKEDEGSPRGFLYTPENAGKFEFDRYSSPKQQRTLVIHSLKQGFDLTRFQREVDVLLEEILPGEKWFLSRLDLEKSSGELAMSTEAAADKVMDAYIDHPTMFELEESPLRIFRKSHYQRPGSVKKYLDFHCDEDTPYILVKGLPKVDFRVAKGVLCELLDRTLASDPRVVEHGSRLLKQFQYRGTEVILRFHTFSTTEALLSLKEPLRIGGKDLEFVSMRDSRRRETRVYRDDDHSRPRRRSPSYEPYGGRGSARREPSRSPPRYVRRERSRSLRYSRCGRSRSPPSYARRDRSSSPYGYRRLEQSRKTYDQRAHKFKPSRSPYEADEGGFERSCGGDQGLWDEAQAASDEQEAIQQQVHEYEEWKCASAELEPEYPRWRDPRFRANPGPFQGELADSRQVPPFTRQEYYSYGKPY